MTLRVRLALVGLGNVGRSFLDLMSAKSAILRERYGIELLLTGAADSSGALIDPRGIDPGALRAHKSSGQPLASYFGAACGMGAPEMVADVPADILLEAAAVNLKSGQPGLDCARTALSRGLGVVLADKGPLVHAFGELEKLANGKTRGLAYSATVCGALPVVNVGRRDLMACEIRRVRGIFNSTSNSILQAMAGGGSYDAALRQAQLDGVAEADPSLDVEGWDTANKLVIICNSILRQPATLADVEPVRGITHITPEDIRAHAERGYVVKLVAAAERIGSSYRLSVQPQWLRAGDFLASVNGWEMGIVFDTDIMGLQQFKVDERGPVPTAGAMLRDLIRLVKTN